MANRTISFTVNSTPQGGAIYIDGTNTYNTTPYTLQYLESELLTPKTISVKNGSSTSVETYILSSEVISNNTTNTGTGGGIGGGVLDPYYNSGYGDTGRAGDINNSIGYLK